MGAPHPRFSAAAPSQECEHAAAASLDKLLAVNNTIAKQQKRVLDIHEESLKIQQQSMKWQTEMIERQNAMGLGSGMRFWWNRLTTQASVALPIGFVSGAVTGAVLPFFAKLMGGIG